MESMQQTFGFISLLTNFIKRASIVQFHSLPYLGDFFHRLYIRQFRMITNINATKNSLFEKILRALVRGGQTATFLFTIMNTTAWGQSQAFLDNFNRLTLISEAPTTYSITVTTGDGGAFINSNSYLELTNDNSGTDNINGIVYVSGLTQDFSGTNQMLHSNTQIIEWTFNFRYNRASNPSGLSAGSYGTAIILGSSNGIFTGTDAGNGYAVVYGNSGTSDPIHLVRFSGGLTGTITNIISSGTNDIVNVNNYVSVRVRYEPIDDNWSLFIRDNGVSNWSDPSTGVVNQIGSTTSDNTYTSISLTHFGFYWAYATATAQTSQFDNFGVKLISEDTSTITVDVSSLPSFGTISIGDSSSQQSFSISGINLTDDIIILPPTGFEVRTGINPFSTNPIILTQTNGAIELTIIDVRFRPINAGSYSGNILCTSTGSTTRNIGVSGVGTLTNLELFLTSDPTLTDSNHAILFPHAGIGEGTTYDTVDWTYNSPVLTFYVVPVGSQSIGASEFEINWDTTKASLSATNGNMFDFFTTQYVSAGKTRINTGASSNLNESPSTGKYLAQLDFTIIRPGFIEITITGTDFRFFDGDTQQTVQATTHSGMIKFYLGDFTSPQNVTSRGDGKINFEDLVQFALVYFSESDGEPAGYKAKFDIGPTNTYGSYFTLPNPDGQIQFEDLAIFSIGYGKSATLQLPKKSTTPILCTVGTPLVNTDGTIDVPLIISGSVNDVRLLSISLVYPSTLLKYIGCEKSGEMNQDYCFIAAKAENNIVTLDAAVIGIEHHSLSKEGTFAIVKFRPLIQSKNFEIKIQSAKVRDSNNHDIPILLNSNEIPISDVPTAFVLSQNYPNPFNPTTQIEYQLPRQVHVEISIYDILGRYVATLVNKEQDVGYYRIEWNGKNTEQQPVSSGIYFYKLYAVNPASVSGNNFVTVKKLILVR